MSVGNYGQQRYALALQAPLVKDKLFLSLGGQHGHRQGVFKNLVTNSDFDEQTSWLFTGTLRYLATNRLSFALSAYDEYNHDTGAYPWVPTRQQIEQQPRQIYSNYLNTERRRNLNTSLRATYRLPGVTLTSVTAFQKYIIDLPDGFDFDFTPLNTINFTNYTRQINFTQELRVASVASSERRLSWTVGTFAFRQSTPDTHNTLFLRTDSLRLPANEQGFLTTGSALNRGIAGFGQVSYQLTEKLSVTSGLRYDYETRELVTGTAFSVGGGPAAVTQADTTLRGTYRAWSPKGILSYQASAHVLAW